VRRGDPDTPPPPPPPLPAPVPQGVQVVRRALQRQRLREMGAAFQRQPTGGNAGRGMLQRARAGMVGKEQNRVAPESARTPPSHTYIDAHAADLRRSRACAARLSSAWAPRVIDTHFQT
jgi:hypothetical protein